MVKQIITFNMYVWGLQASLAREESRYVFTQPLKKQNFRLCSIWRESGPTFGVTIYCPSVHRASPILPTDTRWEYKVINGHARWCHHPWVAPRQISFSSSFLFQQNLNLCDAPGLSSALYIGVSSDNLFNWTDAVFFNAACYCDSCINCISKGGYFQFVHSWFVIRAFQERDRRPDVKANTFLVCHLHLRNFWHVLFLSFLQEPGSVLLKNFWSLWAGCG